MWGSDYNIPKAIFYLLKGDHITNGFGLPHSPKLGPYDCHVIFTAALLRVLGLPQSSYQAQQLPRVELHQVSRFPNLNYSHFRSSARISMNQHQTPQSLEKCLQPNLYHKSNHWAPGLVEAHSRSCHCGMGVSQHECCSKYLLIPQEASHYRAALKRTHGIE